MQKRGQATIFIIIGIIVIFVVAGLFAFREKLFLSEIDRIQAESLIIPDEAKEIHEHISSCLEDITLESLVILGQQGGYINIPEDPIPGYSQNPFSNALTVFEGSDFKTAYWYYKSANNVDKNQMPTIESMQNELASYINTNLGRCVDDNSDLLKKYNFEGSEINTEVEILDESVLFAVDYPVHINIEDFEFDFSKFYIGQDVKLGEMFKTAEEIMSRENNNFIFEDLTYDMLVLNEETPTSWAGFDCKREEWNYEEVKESFKETLYNNILYTKVKNTKYKISDEATKNYYELDLLEKPVDYSANIRYMMEWPLVLDVNPIDDGKLIEDSYTDNGIMAGFLRGLFCLQNYNFVYDIKYPLLISLYDEENDYTFNFATMVVLDNNQARANTEGNLNFEEEPIICDSANKEMTIYALEVDEYGRLVELEDAKISYKCITTECEIGKTYGERGSASLDGLFPSCINGELIGEKDGYYEGREIISSMENDIASVVLERIYNLKYDIKIIDENGGERDPMNDETVYITLTEEDGFTANVYYPVYNETIELIPGKYSIFATLIKEGGGGITVNGKSFNKCVSVPLTGIGGIFGLTKDKCYDVEMDDFELTSMMTGGMEISWEPDREELNDAARIIFYVPESSDVTVVEDLEEVYLNLQAGYGAREPELE